jgi:hypothetical protein
VEAKGHGRHDDLVPRPDVQGAAGEVKRVGSVADPDGIRNSAIFSEISLEEIHLLTENEIAAIDYFRNRSFKIVGNSLALCLEVDKRDGVFK